MDSDEDESLDERPIAYSDSALNHNFHSWLTNFGIRCRRPQANGPLPDLQLYRDSALGTSANRGQGSGSQENYQMFPTDQNEMQPGIKVLLLPDAQLDTGETLPVVLHTHERLCVSQAQGHPNEAVDVVQAQGYPNETVQAQGHHSAPQPREHSSGTVSAVHVLSRDVETQTSIICEGLKEMSSDPMAATSNLPDVIYSSSESSAQSLPTSPDILSNGAFQEHEAGISGLVDCEEASEQVCSEAAAAKGNQSSVSSDASLQQNASFASAVGHPDSQRSDAGKEKQRQFSSGYATQSSRQSEISFSTSCDDGSLVFSQPESRRESLDPLATMFASGGTSSQEKLSSSETVVSWPVSSQKGSVTSYHGNLPDFGQLLSEEELKSTISDHSVREILTEASGILGMAMANDDEKVAVEIPVSVCQPELRMIEEMWNFEMMDPQLSDYALQLINEGRTPAEVEENLLERLNQLPTQNFAAEEEDDAAMEIMSWSEEAQRNCIGCLQIAAACGDKDCGDDCCLFFQELLTDLEDHLRNHTLLYSRLHLELLRNIVEHSAVCSEIRCTVPWCFFFHRGDSDEPEEQISRLLSLYSAFHFGVTREIKVTELDDVQFIQLDESTTWPSIQSRSKLVPEIDTDFEFLAPSAQFGRISFYALSLDIVPKLLYVEMQSAIDETHVWNRLRGLQHPNIVHLLWAYVSHSQAVICCDALTYGDKSLEDVMKEKRTGLLLEEFIQFSVSILSAAKYLNRNHILYLLWTADSVGLMVDGCTVRLRDFSCAVDESRATSDDGELTDLLLSALPPIIISPEMFENDIGRHSEVWGIGCLMFHLAHGFTVHHDLRHCDPDHIRTKVQQWPSFSILRSIQNVPVRNILSQVFVEKSQRLQLEQLREQVLQLQTS